MPKSNTLARSLHDVGLAAWFGGSLMGAAGLNAAAGEVGDHRDRAKVANTGWSRWTAPNAVAIGAHLVGATLLLKANKGRVVAQQGASKAAVAKTALTGVALAATAYARIQGQKVIAAGDPPVLGTTPSSDTPAEVAAAQRRLKLLQWVVPASTGALLVLAAAQSEQQRPAQAAAGVLKRVLPDAVVGLPASVGRVADRAQDLSGRVPWAQSQDHSDRAHALVSRAGDALARVPDVVSQLSDNLSERLPG